MSLTPEQELLEYKVEDLLKDINTFEVVFDQFTNTNSYILTAELQAPMRYSLTSSIVSGLFKRLAAEIGDNINVSTYNIIFVSGIYSRSTGNTLVTYRIDKKVVAVE